MGQGLRTPGGVAGVSIQQQGQRPSAVAPMEELKKGLKVLGALMRLSQKQRVAGPQVQAAKDGVPSVSTADGNGRRVASQRPTRPQRRQERSLGFILYQEHGSRRQGPNLATQLAFFSLAAGLPSARNGSVSRRSRARAGVAESYPLRGRARAGPGPTIKGLAQQAVHRPYPTNGRSDYQK